MITEREVNFNEFISIHHIDPSPTFTIHINFLLVPHDAQEMANILNKNAQYVFVSED